MKKGFKLLLCMSMLFVSLLSFTSKIEAATYSVWTSTSTISPNGSFTVTITGDVIGRMNLSVSNGSLSTSSVWIEENSVTVNVRGGSSGSVSVTVTPEEGLSDGLGRPVSIGSKTVTVSIRQPQSNNNSSSSSNNNSSSSNNNYYEVETPTYDASLNLLSVKEGILSPSFSKDIYEYNVIVPDKTESINVGVLASEEDAEIDGAGKHILEKEQDKISVTVTHGDEVLTYTLTIIKEKPVITLKENKNEVGILNQFIGADILNGFEDYEITIDGKVINAKRNPLNEVVVVYGLNEDGSKNYYIIENNKIVSAYIPVSLFGKQYAMLTLPKELKEMDGFKEGEVTINNKVYSALLYEDKAFKNYSLIYLMDENGKKNLYQYESSENTLQLYANNAPISADKYLQLIEEKDMYKMFTFILVPTASLIGVLAIILAFIKRKK